MSDYSFCCGYGFKLGPDNFQKRKIEEKFHYETRYSPKTGKPYKNKVKVIDTSEDTEYYFMGCWIPYDDFMNDFYDSNVTLPKNIDVFIGDDDVFFVCCSKPKFKLEQYNMVEVFFQEIKREDIPALDKELKEIKKFFAGLGCINLDKTINSFTVVSRDW